MSDTTRGKKHAWFSRVKKLTKNTNKQRFRQRLADRELARNESGLTEEVRREKEKDMKNHLYVPGEDGTCRICGYGEHLHRDPEYLAKEGHSVYMVGAGDQGRNGRGDVLSTVVMQPTRIFGLEGLGVTTVVCGRAHTVAMTVMGEMWSWGYGEYGQLGHGDFLTRHAPYKIKAIEHIKMVNVACGSNFTLFLSAGGDVYGCGANHYGQLALEGVTRTPVPTLLEFFIGKNIRRVSAGALHSSAISEMGQVYMWGKNTYGQLGFADLTEMEAPRITKGLLHETIGHVALGEDSTVALSANLDEHALQHTDSIPDNVAKILAKTSVIKNALSDEVISLHDTVKRLVLVRQDQLNNSKKEVGRLERKITQTARDKGLNSKEMDVLRDEMKQLEFASKSIKKDLRQLRKAENKVDKIQLERASKFGEKYPYLTFQGADPSTLMLGEIEELAQVAVDLRAVRKISSSISTSGEEDITDGEMQFTVRQIIDMWERLKQTDIRNVNQKHGGTGLKDMLQYSNFEIETVQRELKRLMGTTYSGKLARNSLLEVIYDNAVQRRQLNDYTEGLLMETEMRLHRLQQNERGALGVEGESRDPHQPMVR